MSFSLDSIAVTLAEQDGAIEQLRHMFVESRRTDAAAWRATDRAIEVDAVYSSNEIEGSTLSRAETEAVMEHGIAYGGIPYRDFAAAVGDAEALAMTQRLAFSGRKISSNDVGRLIDLLQQSERPEIIGQLGRPSGERLATTIVLAKKDAALTAEWCAWRLAERSGFREAFEAHHDILVRSSAGALAGRLARLLLNFLLTKERLPPLAIDARWQPEYRKRTAACPTMEDGTKQGEADVIAYQHFMGARMLQTLKCAMRLADRPS